MKQAIADEGAFVLRYALALVGVGTLSMALLELIKGLLRARMLYNRWAVREWATRRSRTLGRLVWSGAAADTNGVLAELELLAAGGHDNADALYDQPVEKMMGEVQAAVNVSLDYPDIYTHLYAFITAVPDSYALRGATVSTPADAEQWSNGVARVRRQRAQAVASQGTPSDEQDVQAISLARSRLTNLVTRRLDAFQSQTQYFWERLNQWSSMGLGALIFACAGLSISKSGGDTLTILLLAIPAGIVAPFAKDLASGLASFGK
ncbi:MAG TPA: hypothetical protein VMB48_03500 [Steroidobacteraceae bacterium]|nr:hypothetical protein [Steroidobacteraceae bacterium]